MKRTPEGELKVPEIVGREALRDEVLFLFFFIK